MSKAIPAAPDASPQTDVSAPIALSLHEFCLRMSSRITLPELIAAFEHTERAAGRLSDTDPAYAARFDAFAHLPV